MAKVYFYACRFTTPHQPPLRSTSHNQPRDASMRRMICNSLLFILCTAFTSYFIQVARGALSTTYEPPLLKSDMIYAAKRAAQLTFSGLGEEVARHLLSRLGAPIDLYIIIIAAAPLDYLLTQAVPSWDLVGLPPCDQKLSIAGTFGGCAYFQASFCYQYSAAGVVDFHEMETCYKQHRISVREAHAHSQQCHARFPTLYQMSYWSCAANVMQDVLARKQSCDLTSVVVRCGDRHGMRTEVFLDLQHSDTFRDRVEPCKDDSGEECVVLKSLTLSAPFDE
jgi:hypothetical protein